MLVVANSKGQRFFGIHMYPGVAEYREQGKDPYRVFLNEDTIRSMDASFEGRPVYVHHVDGVEPDIDTMRKDMDGVVVRSFYNEADGKHWVEFVVVSEKGLRAVKSGMKLSNCYLPTGSASGGTWNGLNYQRQITQAEYEHLAIVPDPRYAESVILTPEQFKAYNEDKRLEVTRLANNGDSKMKFSFWKRDKVENSADFASVMVTLPKSGRDVSIEALINAADKDEEDKSKPKVASGDHMVECNGMTMTVDELKGKHKEMCDALEDLKKKHVDGDKAEDKADDKKEDSDEERKANALKADADAKAKADAEADKARAKAAADRLANAEGNISQEPARFELSIDGAERGRAKYGS